MHSIQQKLCFFKTLHCYWLTWMTWPIKKKKKNVSSVMCWCVWRGDQYPINYIQCSIFDQSDNILTNNKYFLDLGTSLICPNKFPLNTLHWIEREYLDTLQIYFIFLYRIRFFQSIMRWREIIFWNLLVTRKIIRLVEPIIKI